MEIEDIINNYYLKQKRNKIAKAAIIIDISERDFDVQIETKMFNKQTKFLQVKACNKTHAIKQAIKYLTEHYMLNSYVLTGLVIEINSQPKSTDSTFYRTFEFEFPPNF
jgi:hypothetical protein